MSTVTMQQIVAGPTSTPRPGSVPQPRSRSSSSCSSSSMWSSPTTTSRRASSCPARRDPRAPGARGLRGLARREMTTVMAHLTNKAYGFPTRGAPRRIKAPVLACIHITGNRRTAANPDRHQAARDERTYANRAGSKDRRPTTTSPATAGRSRPSTRRGTPPGRTATSRARTPRTPASPRCSPCAPRATTPTRRTGRDRVRRLRLDVPDHQGPAAVRAARIAAMAKATGCR